MSRLLAWGIVLALSGCAALGPQEAPKAATPQKPILVPGRAMVLPIITDEANRPLVESVARLVAQGLHDRWGNIVPYETFLSVAQKELRAPRELGLRLVLNGPGAERQWLIERMGIQTLLLVDVYDLEQRWARSGKATRVGVDVRALHLPSSDLLWRARYRPEIEGRSGRAVSTSVELAVHQLIKAIHGETEGLIATQWWLWQR